MSKDEIKQEINKVLDQLSDKALQNLLSFLKNIDRSSTLTGSELLILEKILSEDNELLEKLAK